MLYVVDHKCGYFRIKWNDKFLLWESLNACLWLILYRVIHFFLLEFSPLECQPHFAKRMLLRWSVNNGWGAAVRFACRKQPAIFHCCRDSALSGVWVVFVKLMLILMWLLLLCSQRVKTLLAFAWVLFEVKGTKKIYREKNWNSGNLLLLLHAWLIQM